MAITGVVEWLALIVALVALVKMVVILIKPKVWIKIIGVVYKNKIITPIVSLILAGVVLYYLLGAEISIIDIFAVMAFISLLAVFGVSVYSEEVLSVAQKLLKDRNIVKRSWLYLIIWMALTVWALYELLV